MNAIELRTITVDEHTMAVQYGVRPTDTGDEHVVTVPGTEICVTGATEGEAIEKAVDEIRTDVAARREESERLAREAQNGEIHTEVDGQPAVFNGKSGGVKAADTTKAQREEEALRLIDVSLEELARTLATLDDEAKPHAEQKSRAENALNKITQKRKVVIAELNRRGHKIIERDLGKNEFDMR